jgi:hypothetical protein
MDFLNALQRELVTDLIGETSDHEDLALAGKLIRAIRDVFGEVDSSHQHSVNTATDLLNNRISEIFGYDRIAQVQLSVSRVVNRLHNSGRRAGISGKRQGSLSKVWGRFSSIAGIL